ncbi:MAG: hypothetical protein M0P12_08570, partial [Paludibacteraceae bacterium]|nr:hypothetical protein [Paludibacteraceae bacterium]
MGQTLEYRMAFLAFGIIGFFGHNQYYKLSYFMYTIILTCIILTINIILHIGIMNFIQTDYKIYFFALTRNMLVNTHMKFNFYVNFAIVSCYYLWKTNQNKYFRIA